MNKEGRDFVIGDIHAHKDRLLDALESVSFDKTKDRLFSVGDVIDWGDAPLEILDYLDNEWFYAVKGNHEQMVLDRFDFPMTSPLLFPRFKTRLDAEKIHRHKGGTWFDALCESSQRAVYNRFKQHPVAITLNTPKGKVGIVHAEVPETFVSWKDFVVALDTNLLAREHALWNRVEISKFYDVRGIRYLDSSESNPTQRWIDDVSATVHGHTGVMSPVLNGNQMWIDTGHLSSKLTIIEANSLIDAVSAAQ